MLPIAVMEAMKAIGMPRLDGCSYRAEARLTARA